MSVTTKQKLVTGFFVAAAIAGCTSDRAQGPVKDTGPVRAPVETPAKPPGPGVPTPSQSTVIGAPAGAIKGSATKHTALSQVGAVTQATIGLPASLTGGRVFYGRWAAIPSVTLNLRVPVVVFLHGSSGVSLKAIEEWQRWLASIGVASVVPDSFALANRLQYQSPVDKGVYEQIHALRSSEITLALQALQNTPWADTRRMVLAGSSEGAVAVARYKGPSFVGRMLFAWSCEDNYYVSSHQTFVGTAPVLNIISTTDPFFSTSNTWVGLSTPLGHCGSVFASNKNFTLQLVPNAPHTLFHLPAPKQETQAFLKRVMRL
jgi:dienelactone hydrolase